LYVHSDDDRKDEVEIFRFNQFVYKDGSYTTKLYSQSKLVTN